LPSDNFSSLSIQRSGSAGREKFPSPKLAPSLVEHGRSADSNGKAEKQESGQQNGEDNGIAVQNVDNGVTQTQWSMGLDDFEMLTVIGRGSYAKVVQAEHKYS
jgi:hypothetical protein